jgi:N-acetylmuramoyl-L-alanine amidase
MIRLLLILILASLTWSFAPVEERFRKVPALQGDGVYSLLRRYQLDEYSCNHKKFYELNKMKKSTSLKVGKYYYIPVLIYDFNGNTIRSSIGVDNWDLAKRIENYNKKMMEDGFRKETYQDDLQLWVPYHELNCGKTKLPNKPKPAINTQTASAQGETNLAVTDKTARQANRTYPIFGKKYEYTPQKSKEMSGKVFYIVSGHGGRDPGAVGKKGKYQLCEDEYAYDVALRLCRNLIANGATAYMIVRDPNDGIRDNEILKCDTDERIWGGARIMRSQKPRLFQRSNAINKLYEKHKKQGVTEQHTVVIHVDSRSKRQQTDLFFYYHPNSVAGKKFALKMHKSIRAKYLKHRISGEYHGTVTGRDLHMLRETKTPSVYIELGNISHPFDQKRIVLKSNREALGKWLYESLR